MSADKIFICYRREDSAGYAGRIYDRLNQRFPDRVFRDVDKIPVLNRWETVVDETLRSCAVAVVVIGSRWLEHSADGKRRLDLHDAPPQMRPGDGRVMDVQLSTPMPLAKGLIVPLRRDGKTMGFGSILG